MSWRPQLVCDGVGMHLVWGEWMLSPSLVRFDTRSWLPRHVTNHSQLGAVRTDVWLWAGLRLSRTRLV